MTQHPEAFLQQQFVHWLDAKGYLFTAFMTGNIKISRFAAVMKKRLGVKAGFPDIFLAETNDKYAGLFIELKAPNGNFKDPLQTWWRDELNKRKYLAVIMPKGLEYPQSFYWLRDLVEKYMKNEL